jgi:hypothetical protein
MPPLRAKLHFIIGFRGGREDGSFQSFLEFILASLKTRFVDAKLQQLRFELFGGELVNPVPFCGEVVCAYDWFFIGHNALISDPEAEVKKFPRLANPLKIVQSLGHLNKEGFRPSNHKKPEGVYKTWKSIL